MSNGEPSRSPYIIICGTETALLTTDNIKEKVRIVQQGAVNMAIYLGLTAKDEFTVEDSRPISDCLHWFEANIAQAHKEDIEAKIAELVAILNGLHVKFAGY
jgi:hypothetical protein